MKSIFKKFTLLALSAITAFSCIACGGNDSSGNNGGNNGPDGWAYTDEQDENVTEISIFKNDWDSFKQARNANSPVYAALKSKLGFDIDAQNSSGSNWQTAIGLRQADNDLPDIFLTEGPTDPVFFERLLDNEDILCISDWVDEAHYPNLYNYLQKFSYMRTNVSMFNGKMWYIPSTWHNEKSLFVRQDWIDNLNAKLDDILVDEGIVDSKVEITDEIREQWKFKLPEDLLEFYRLARAFTKYDPDNNGVDDTVGYMSESNKDMDGWIYQAFGAGWKQWVKNEDGEYTLSFVTDGAKYATNFIANLISDGYMSVDSLTADNGTKQDKFMTGKAGMMYAHNWLNQFVGGLMSLYKCTLEEATAKIAMIDPPKGENGVGGGCGSEDCWQGFCINANMSNSRIRACLSLYEYLLSDEGYELMQYGVKGVQWDEVEGKKVALYEANDQGMISTIVSEDTATMLYALVDWTMHYRSEVQTNADIIVAKQLTSEKNPVYSDYPSIQTAAMIEHYTDAYNKFKETIATLEKISANNFKDYNPKTFTWSNLKAVNKTLDAQWKGYVREMSSSYYVTDMTEEYNDFINSGNATKVTK